MAVKLIRGLSLYGSIDQVWQTAVPGFYIIGNCISYYIKKPPAGCALRRTFFQFLMPMVGWICVHTIVQLFGQFQKCIPWIALILLLYIGGSMIWESVKGEEEIEEVKKLSFAVLMLQGIATSIDALSVGFTIADYGFVMALVCSIIIAVVTFAICETGLYLGKTLGTKLTGKADVLGGVILTGIGIEIFVKGVFF